jgi:hypothetical protein
MGEGKVQSLLVKLGFHANGMEIIQRRVDPLLGPAGLPWYIPLKINTLKGLKPSPVFHFIPGATLSVLRPPARQ